MREIKFRGRRVDSGEWLYGDLLTRRNTLCTIPAIVVFEGNVLPLSYSVDIGTVGQFTGLRDKHGVEIYEGDVGKTFNGSHGVVEFGEYKCSDILYTDECFYNETIPGADGERSSVGWHIKCKDGCCGLDNRIDLWFEKIGNIHQNPELLEAKP